jgi:hypothetical protein
VGIVDTMTFTKRKFHLTCNTGMRVSFNREKRGMRVLLSNWITARGGGEEESETRWMNKKRTLLLNFFFFSIWLFRLEQWRRQRVPAGPPVSQHARRARPLIGRSEHGSSSRFFLQRHRFLSAHCPSQRKGITLTKKFNI